MIWMILAVLLSWVCIALALAMLGVLLAYRRDWFFLVLVFLAILFAA